MDILQNLQEYTPLFNFLFGSGLLVTVGKYLLNRVKDNEKKTEAVCLGVQALLRDRLIHEYNKYIDKGYIPIYAKENFDNMFQQYHNLGVNGVMNEVHETIMHLPTEPKGE